MSITYYGLMKDEEPPEQFCAVRYDCGEPSEYHWYISEQHCETDETGFVTRVEIDGRWYVPEGENAKLRELVRGFLSEHADYIGKGNYFIGDLDLENAMHHNQAYFRREARKLGIEVDE